MVVCPLLVKSCTHPGCEISCNQECWPFAHELAVPNLVDLIFHFEPIPKNPNLRKFCGTCALSSLLTVHKGHATFQNSHLQQPAQSGRQESQNCAGTCVRFQNEGSNKISQNIKCQKPPKGGMCPELEADKNPKLEVDGGGMVTAPKFPPRRFHITHGELSTSLTPSSTFRTPKAQRKILVQQMCKIRSPWRVLLAWSA